MAAIALRNRSKERHIVIGRPIRVSESRGPSGGALALENAGEGKSGARKLEMLAQSGPSPKAGGAGCALGLYGPRAGVPGA